MYNKEVKKAKETKETKETKNNSYSSLIYNNINNTNDDVYALYVSKINNKINNNYCDFCNEASLELKNIYDWKFYNPLLNRFITIKNSIYKHNIHNLIKVQTISINNNNNNNNNNNTDNLENINNTENIELENAILQCAKILVDDFKQENSLNILLKTVVEYYGATKSYIFEIDEKEKFFYNTSEYHKFNNVDLERVMPRMSIKPIRNWLSKLLNDNELYINSLDELDLNSIEYKILATQNLEGIVAVPLCKNDKFFGFIGMTNPQKNFENLYLLKTIAAFTVNEIEKRQMNEKLSQKVLDLEETLRLDKAMLKCATILLSGENIKSSINQLLETIAEFYISDRVYIFEINYDKKTFSNTYEYCEPNINSQLEIMQSKNLDIIMSWFKLFKKQEIIDIANLREDKNFDNILIEAPEKYKSHLDGVDDFIIKPLIKNNQVLGFLGMNNKKNTTTDYKLLNNVSAFIINDIIKRDMVKELQEMSFTDCLTGLYNRNYFTTISLQLEENIPQKLGIIYADVNGLKRVNDKLGHEYGDYLIQWAGEFLSNHIDNIGNIYSIDNSEIFRLGGDEFLSLIQNQEMTSKDFFELVNNIKNDLFENYSINISIGAVWRDGNVNIAEQVSEADAEMYKVKKEFYKKKSKSYKSNLSQDLENIKTDLENYKIKKEFNKKNSMI